MADDNSTKSGEAKGAEKITGWTGLLIELIRGFILLRDVIGYAMPGAVFLGLAALAYRDTLRPMLKSAYVFSAWGTVLSTVIACYAVGNALVALAYIPLDVREWVSRCVSGKMTKKESSVEAETGNPSESSKGAVLESTALKETRSRARILFVRLRYPELLIELERREIVNMFRGATGVALLGAASFYVKQTPFWPLLAGGVVLLFSFFLTAPRHLMIMHLATVQAAKLAEKAKKDEKREDKKETSADKGLLGALKDFLNQRFK